MAKTESYYIYDRGTLIIESYEGDCLQSYVRPAILYEREV